MSDAPLTHLQIAEIDLKLECARSLFENAIKILDEYSTSGKEFTQKVSIRIKAQYGYANQLCKEAYDLMLADQVRYLLTIATYSRRFTATLLRCIYTHSLHRQAYLKHMDV